MTPFYFGDSKKQLYGVYHPSTTYSQNTEAVLICYPLWREYFRTHRAITQLANKLADSGFPVLRFDYSATGDSAGSTDECSLGQWLQDIEAAISELKDLSAAGKVSIVGLRFGATLAALISQRTQINQLVLWDPVVDGKSYIQNMKDMHNAYVKLHLQEVRQPVHKLSLNDDEYFGFKLPNTVLSSVSEVDLLKTRLKANYAYLCVTEEKPEFRAFLDYLSEQKIKSAYNFVESTVAWDSLAALAVVHIPPAIIQGIVDSFKNGIK